ncbi:hypothetical protein CBR_g39083 [Chara braunii]|uniref:NADP-dependent oxidoreductase domain-containing protein n=1 Tax=Chara braunii TaxID=69332 RepID=A0A388LQW8_CHABU|nr:hypothetical protein CBR_g39083 [Chara braunii]|eukprot:GBG84707.1 hypothetical protein CBR_g39083 [Chara braunii]
MNAVLAPTLRLVNGVEMPRVGLGTFRMRGNEAKSAVQWALEAGYRHVDTASIYKNESEIAWAIKESGLPREVVFITSKVSPLEQGYEAAMAAFAATCSRLDTAYLDLYLIHWPGVAKMHVKSERNGQLRADTWRALEDLYRQGRCRAIGVSNYTDYHLRELLSSCHVRPMVNQVELHPMLTQHQLGALCCENAVQIEAYSSLGCGELLRHPVVIEISAKYKRTPAQVLLRWGLQHGHVVIPKSVSKERIFRNFDLFDFEIQDVDMAALNELNEDRHFCWNPNEIA